MEVHHHSHTARKKWTHYFWEFLMLFLAVFCGFFAELQLEHKIEKDRMRRYVAQLINSLKRDTTEINSGIEAFEFKQKLYDTLFYFLAMPVDDSVKWKGIQRKVALLENPFRFTHRKAAIEQMVSAGAFRLFKNDSIIEELLEYERGGYMIEKQIDAEVLFVMQVSTPFLNKYFDKKRAPQRLGWAYKPLLPNKNDPGSLPVNFLSGLKEWKQEFENIVITSRERNTTPLLNMRLQQKSGIKLIAMLKQEFKFK